MSVGDTGVVATFVRTRAVSSGLVRSAATTDGASLATAVHVPLDSAGWAARSAISCRYQFSSEAGSRDSSATLTVAGSGESGSHGSAVLKPAAGCDASQRIGVRICASGLSPVIPISSP